MLVCYMDRIRQLHNGNPNKLDVIATSLDWAAAYDWQNPTIAVEKFVKMGVRPTLVPLLANYLSGRKKAVRFNIHDWSIDKPKKAEFENDLNCMIDCVKLQPHLLFLI